MLEALPDVVLVTDRTGQVLYVNRTVSDADPADVVGTPLARWTPKEHRDRVEAVLREVVETGEPGRLEIPVPAPDGTPRRYEGRFHPLAGDDGTEGVLVVARDVSEQVLAKEDLARYRRLHDAVVEAQNALDVGLMVLDLDSMAITYANDAFFDGVHRGRDYVQSLPDITMVVAPEARNRVQEAMTAMMTEGRPLTLEFPILDRKGRRRWLRSWASLLQEDPPRIVAAFLDLTEERRTAQERRLLLELSRRLSGTTAEGPGPHDGPPDLDAALSAALDAAARTTPWTLGEAWRPRGGPDRDPPPELVARRPAGAAQTGAPVGEALAARVLADGEPVAITNAEDAGGTGEAGVRGVLPADAGSAVAVPVVQDGAVVAALVFLAERTQDAKAWREALEAAGRMAGAMAGPTRE